MQSGRRLLSSLALIGLAVAAAPAVARADFALLHRDTQYGGSNPLTIAADIDNLAGFGWDNTASSITIKSDQPIAVYQDPGFRGACLTVRGNIGRLSDVGFGNDNISSVRVAWTCEQGAYEVDACRANPCGAGFACNDLPRPAATGWTGRTCVPDGHTPASLTLGKPARQSSTAFGGVAGRAVDGRTDGVWPAESITSTNLEAGWLEIDLGSTQDIGLVVLHNRTDCCAERLIGARLELTLEPCDRADRTIVARGDPVTTAAATHPRTFEPRARARYLCVRHDRPQYLGLAEVQAFAGWQPPTEISIGQRLPTTAGPATGAFSWAYTVTTARSVRLKHLTWTAGVAAGQWVEARVWDEAGAIVARGQQVFGTGATAPLVSPIDVTLEAGRTYRIGFRDQVGASPFPRAVFSPDASGALVWPSYVEATGIVVTGAVSSLPGKGDAPPTTPNAFAPVMTMSFCASFVCR